MSFSRLLNDCVRVRLEPVPEKTAGGILIPSAEDCPLRKGVVLQVGPGRYTKVRRRGPDKKYDEVWRPLESKTGDRVAFFIASVDTKSGKAVSHYLAEDERVIRESDILFFLLDGTDVEVTV